MIDNADQCKATWLIMQTNAVPPRFVMQTNPTIFMCVAQTGYHSTCIANQTTSNKECYKCSAWANVFQICTMSGSMSDNNNQGLVWQSILADLVVYIVMSSCLFVLCSWSKQRIRRRALEESARPIHHLLHNESIPNQVTIPISGCKKFWKH